MVGVKLERLLVVPGCLSAVVHDLRGNRQLDQRVGVPGVCLERLGCQRSSLLVLARPAHDLREHRQRAPVVLGIDAAFDSLRHGFEALRVPSSRGPDDAARDHRLEELFSQQAMARDGRVYVVDE